MSDKKKKPTPEQLKQLQQLQQMIAMQGKGLGMPDELKEKPKRDISLRGMFIAMLQGMEKSIKFIDQFTNFVVKKDSDTTNDVIKNARSPILFGTYIILLFVLGGVIWSATAPLDSAAVAIGTVISQTKKKIINHQEGGIIKNIYVKLGDSVKRGDKLLELDATRIKSEYESVLNQYRTHLATENRLLAELNDDDTVTYSEFLSKDKGLEEVAKIIKTQNNLFESKKELKKAEKDSLSQKIHQLKKQIEGLHAKKTSAKKTLEVVQDRLHATKQLNKKGFAQKAALLELEAKEANAVSEIALTDTEIARSEQEIIKTEIDLINLESKFTTQALSELKEAQVNVSAHRERFFALKDSLSRVVVTSPVDGIVNNINYHTIGSVIPHAQNIIEISPSDDTLIIEAKIPPKNIDSIRIGLVSKIRFSAFKSRTTPLFTGKVVSLSPDIVVDPRQQMDPRLAGGYYIAQIELDMEQFEEMTKGKNLELHPGMQAEVQIVTGTRTLLRYLLDPAIDAMFHGFTEK